MADKDSWPLSNSSRSQFLQKNSTDFLGGNEGKLGVLKMKANFALVFEIPIETFWKAIIWVIIG